MDRQTLKVFAAYAACQTYLKYGYTDMHAHAVALVRSVGVNLRDEECVTTEANARWLRYYLTTTYSCLAHLAA